MFYSQSPFFHAPPWVYRTNLHPLNSIHVRINVPLTTVNLVQLANLSIFADRSVEKGLFDLPDPLPPEALVTCLSVSPPISRPDALPRTCSQDLTELANCHTHVRICKPVWHTLKVIVYNPLLNAEGISDRMSTQKDHQWQTLGLHQVSNSSLSAVSKEVKPAGFSCTCVSHHSIQAESPLLSADTWSGLNLRILQD